MSNGEDVLDNWEEIDEARLKDTLQKIEAARKTKLKDTTTFQNGEDTNVDTLTLLDQSKYAEKLQPMKLLQRTSNPASDKGNENDATVLKSPLNDMAASFQPVMMVLHKSNDDYQSANYTQPINSQTVKILRRPTQSSEPRNNGVKPKQPIKTLQQREQEYAEARLRILGVAKNPEDDLTANSTANIPTTAGQPNTAAAVVNSSKVTSPKTPGTTSNSAYNNQNNYHHHQQQTNFYYQQQLPLAPAFNNRTLMALHQQTQSHHIHHQSSQQTWSPIVGGSVSSPILRQQQQQQLPQHHQQDSVLRLPRGPDGSTGFQIRR